MKNQTYPVMFHHEYKGEELIGSCFAYRNSHSFVTAGHIFDDIGDDYSKIHIGVEHEVVRNSPMPDTRTVRNAVAIARHCCYDLAFVIVNREFDAPMSEPFFNHIADMGTNCEGERIRFCGYTDHRLSDRKITARQKHGSVTQDYRFDRSHRPIIEIEGTVEHKNSGGPLMFDEHGTGYAVALITSFKGTSNSTTQDDHGEALLLCDFKDDLRYFAEKGLESPASNWSRIL